MRRGGRVRIQDSGIGFGGGGEDFGRGEYGSTQVRDLMERNLFFQSRKYDNTKSEVFIVFRVMLLGLI
jgi:hypothetical protein